MSNLGYFQLKASPGLWRLAIAPGRSRELFGVDAAATTGGATTGGAAVTAAAAPAPAAKAAAAEGTEAATAAAAADGTPLVDGVTTFIASFSGRHVQLRVRKRAGKEAEQLLPAADGAGKGAGATAVATPAKRGSNKGSGDAAGDENDDDVINVFTVASGHMYERLQKIMMLSVIKNTRSR